MKQEEIRLINIQLYTLIFSLISILISIALTYNEKLNLEGLEPFINSEDNYNTTLFNRILILAIAVSFLYINYQSYKLSKEKEENVRNYQIQVFVAILSTIAAAISLYVVSRSNSSDIEVALE